MIGGKESLGHTAFGCTYAALGNRLTSVPVFVGGFARGANYKPSRTSNKNRDVLERSSSTLIGADRSLHDKEGVVWKIQIG